MYQPSDPFLVVSNQGPLTATQVTNGALAINTAADDAANLPGDFNHNGTVDAADYTVRRNGLGGAFDPSDYTEWKNNFGDSAGAGSVASVPEPALLKLFAGGLLAPFARRRRTN